MVLFVPPARVLQPALALVLSCRLQIYAVLRRGQGACREHLGFTVSNFPTGYTCNAHPEPTIRGNDQIMVRIRWA